jgi:agmatine deiminase
MTPNPDQTPASLGYRMPAEWEPHATTWIAWPHNRDDWPGKFGPIPWVYAEIVRLLTRSEPVSIIVKSRRMRRQAADALDAHGANLDRVTFVKAATDRVWTRDTGPTFVVNDSAQTPESRVALVDWKFNGWAKYDNHRRDDRIPRKLERLLRFPRFIPKADVQGKLARVVMEGGAIDVNGKGTLLATEECLLSEIQERNPGLGREGIEKVFAEVLNVSNVVWLGRGIEGDDTHGHVDDLARFVDERTIVTVIEPNPDDPNHEPLQENLVRLQAARDQNGEAFQVATLPMPEPVLFEGQRLPASYANFYIANNLVLVPTFNDPNDGEALATISSLFPTRAVIGVHAVDLVLGLGTLHCLTQQQPA